MPHFFIVEEVNMRSKKTLKSFSPKNILATAVALGSCSMSAQAYAAAETVADALASGTAYGDLRLRYETVDQDNALKDASALTLRTRLGYKTAEYSGSSGLV